MSTFRRILVVVESIDAETSSGAKGRISLIKNLHSAGFKLQVLHFSRKDIQIDGIDCRLIPEKKFSMLFFLSRTERFLRNKLKKDIHKPLEKIFGFSFTLLNDRNSIMTSLRKEVDFQPDLVLTLSQGSSFRPHHAILKMPELHNKWVAYIHDPYPMHFYPRPYVWVEPGYYQKWFFMKQVSIRARYAAFPSQLLLEWMGSYFKDFLEKGFVIPHQIPERDEIPANLPAFFNPKKFNLLHAGNLLHARNPEFLIEAFEFFLKKHKKAEKDAVLTFVGGHSFHSDLLMKKKNKIAQLQISGVLPFEQVLEMQKKTSVNIILEAKSEISPFLPGKFPHCIAANRPILLMGPYYSESRRLLGRHYPHWTEADDIQKTAQLIENLYAQWTINKDLTLERPDLKRYLSSENLKLIVQKLLDS